MVREKRTNGARKKNKWCETIKNIELTLVLFELIIEGGKKGWCAIEAR
jgi:hypothetical protein